MQTDHKANGWGIPGTHYIYCVILVLRPSLLFISVCFSCTRCAFFMF